MIQNGVSMILIQRHENTNNHTQKGVNHKIEMNHGLKIQNLTKKHKKDIVTSPSSILTSMTT